MPKKLSNRRRPVELTLEQLGGASGGDWRQKQAIDAMKVDKEARGRVADYWRYAYVKRQGSGSAAP